MILLLRCSFSPACLAQPAHSSRHSASMSSLDFPDSPTSLQAVTNHSPSGLSPPAAPSPGGSVHPVGPQGLHVATHLLHTWTGSQGQDISKQPAVSRCPFSEGPVSGRAPTSPWMFDLGELLDPTPFNQNLHIIKSCEGLLQNLPEITHDLFNTVVGM